jgi:hypothetical protein
VLEVVRVGIMPVVTARGARRVLERVRVHRRDIAFELYTYSVGGRPPKIRVSDIMSRHRCRSERIAWIL